MKPFAGTYGYGDIGLVTVPLATCVLLLSLNVKTNSGVLRWIGYLGKHSSTAIYLWHKLAYAIIIIIAARLPLGMQGHDFWALPATVAVITLGTCMYTRIRQRNIRCKIDVKCCDR